MNRVIPLPGCGRRAAVTDHALDRWLERVRWVDNPEQALEELDRLMQVGTFTELPPDWWQLEDDVATLTFGFVTAGDVCFVICHKRTDVERLVVATLATRGDLSADEREYRHRLHRDRRHRARLRARKAGGTRGPRGPERRKRRDELERSTDTRRWAA